MFNRKPKDDNLTKEIDRVFKQMQDYDPGTAQYAACSEQLDKLYKVRATSMANRVKPDTWLMAASNLLGIGAILGYEKANVLTSKALGFVTKPRA